MSRLLGLGALVGIILAGPTAAQLIGHKTASGCIAIPPGDTARVTATGRLTLRHMPGPPNFENIRHGDEDELTFILVLPDAICIDDGGNGADPRNRFRTVHVWTSDPIVHRKLSKSVGQTVSIAGNGYPMDNAFHYAPLVLQAKAVRAPLR